MSNSVVHVFTSITSNYIPKARVLAASVKRVSPSTVFHLMLCDTPPADFNLADEPFDSLLDLQSLGVPELKQWVFGHTVVELCTAVKGFAFRTLLARGAQKVFYFDPDMVVFDRLDELIGRLEGKPVASETAPSPAFKGPQIAQARKALLAIWDLAPQQRGDLHGRHLPGFQVHGFLRWIIRFRQWQFGLGLEPRGSTGVAAEGAARRAENPARRLDPHPDAVRRDVLLEGGPRVTRFRFRLIHDSSFGTSYASPLVAERTYAVEVAL